MIESRRDGCAVFSKNRHSTLDDLDLSGRQSSHASGEQLFFFLFFFDSITSMLGLIVVVDIGRRCVVVVV